MKKVLFLFVALLLVTLSSWGANWFVDPTGTDDVSHGTTTGAGAFRTIQYAINDSRVVANDVINVAAGTYNTGTNISVTKQVTIQGAPGPYPQIVTRAGVWNGNYTQGIVIVANGAILRHLDVSSATGYDADFGPNGWEDHPNYFGNLISDYGFWNGGGGTNNWTIDDCLIHYGFSGVMANGTGITIQNSTIYDIQGLPHISLPGAGSVTIQNNWIHEDVANVGRSIAIDVGSSLGPNSYPFGDDVYDCAAGSGQVVNINHNYIYGMATGVKVELGSGVPLGKVVIAHNTIDGGYAAWGGTGSGDEGIYLGWPEAGYNFHQSYLDIRDNIIYRERWYGIVDHGVGCKLAENIAVTNSLLYGNYRDHGSASQLTNEWTGAFGQAGWDNATGNFTFGGSAVANPLFMESGSTPQTYYALLNGSPAHGTASDGTDIGAWQTPPVHNITQDTYFTTIQSAINAATTNDVINVAAGTYPEAITVNKTNLTIQGAGTASTIITTTGTTPAITLTSNGFTLKDLKITNATDLIYGIKVNGATSVLTIDNVHFTNLGRMYDDVGGYAIYFPNNFSGLSVNNSRFVATYLGQKSNTKCIRADQNLELSNFSVTNSTFEYFFIAIDLRSEIIGLTVTGNTFGPQEAQEIWGGTAAIYIGDGYAGKFEIDNVNISNNLFTSFTKGVYICNYTAGEKIKSVQINDNTFTNSLYSSPIRILAYDASSPYTESAILEGPLTIHGNTFTQNAPIPNGQGVAMVDVRIGIEDATNPITVSGNNITFTGGPYSLSTWGILFRGPVSKLNITNNVMDGNNVGGTYTNMPATSGIVFETDYTGFGPMSSSADINVTGNSIREFTNGIAVYNFVTNTYGGVPAGASIGVSSNSITSNTKAIYSGSGEIIDGTCNWYGSTLVSEVAAKINGAVTYIPYSVSEGGTCTGPPVLVKRLGAIISGHNVIQAAIDASTTLNGDIITVAAGTYNETLNFSSGFNKNDLTITGDPADKPIITQGVRFLNIGTISGLTLDNLYIKGAAGASPLDNLITMRQSGNINNFTLSNCVLDGENIATRRGFRGGKLGGTFTITGTEFKNILQFMVLDNQAAAGGPFTTIAFTNNNIHNCNGSVALKGNSADRTDVMNVFGNVWNNIGGNNAVQGDQWAAIEISNTDQINCYSNQISNVIQGTGGEGQAIQMSNIGNVNIHSNSITNNYQGILIYGANPIPSGNIDENDISNNTVYGISVDPLCTGSALNATCNWWGTTNAYAVAAAVSGNVQFLPFWTTSTGPCGGVGPVVNTTNSPNRSYMTIQAAIDATTTITSDVITVAAGIYNEAVNVNKTLTLKGSQFGVTGFDASRPAANESVITRTTAVPSAGVWISANGVILDGFIIEKTAPNGSGVGVGLSAGASGYEIKNCIIRNNTMGLYLASEGTTQTKITGNHFLTNNVSGSASGDAIYGDAHAVNILIDNNKFENNNSGGLVFVSSIYGSYGPLSNLTLSNNTVIGKGFAVSAQAAYYNGGLNTDLQVINNHFNGGNTTTIGLRVMGADNALISGNTFTGYTETAIDIQYLSKGVTLENNSMSGNGRSVFVRGWMSGDDVALHNNSFSNNSSVAVANLESEAWPAYTAVSATNNYWGCPSVSGLVTYFPYYSTVTGTPGSFVFGGQITNISASTSDLTICNGQSTTLYAGNGSDFIWGDGLGSGANKVVSPAVNTTYTVTGKDLNGCTGGTASIAITVNDMSAVYINGVQNGSTTIASGSSPVTLTATAAGVVSYLWNTGSTEDHIHVSPPGSTVYTVIVYTASCSGSANHTVNVVNIDAGQNQVICRGNTASLNATISGITPVSYLWSPAGSLSNAAIQNPVATPTITTVYTVTINGAYTDNVTVYVNPKPVANAGQDLTISPSGSGTLTGSASAGTSPYRYAWSGPSSYSCLNQVATVSEEGTYLLTVTDAYGCSSSADNAVVSIAASGYTVSGNVSYLNTVNAQMHNVTVRLKQGGVNKYYGKTPATGDGDFSIPGVADGIYEVFFELTTAWGGVTSTDIIDMQNHYKAVGAIPLIGIKRLAGDVINNSSSAIVIANDRDLVNSKRLNPAVSFLTGNWVFTRAENVLTNTYPIPYANSGGYSDITITVSGTNVIQNFKSLCYGDVNASYTGVKDLEGDMVDVTEGDGLNLTHFPNPFNTMTTIRFIMPVEGTATVDIYDLLGARVKRMTDPDTYEGVHTINCEAAGMVPGVYIFVLMVKTSDDILIQTGKMVVSR